MSHRPTMQRRWHCPTCRQTWSERTQPVHTHELLRLCPFSDCAKETPMGQACCEEHGIRVARLQRGLEGLEPAGLLTGLALFRERRRRGVDRAAVRRAVRSFKNAVWLLEVYDRPIPPDWMPALQELGLFTTSAKPAPAEQAPEAMPAPALPPMPAPLRLQCVDGLQMALSEVGVRVDLSWGLLGRAASLIAEAAWRALLTPPSKPRP